MNIEMLRDFISPIHQVKYLMNFGDAEFSKRMLKEHLSQESEFASRTIQEIDRQVDFLFNAYLRPQKKVLDLACGPGLYTSRFAAKGAYATGLDISPSAIEYATARAGDLEKYQQMDLEEYNFQGEFDLVIMLFGIINNLSNIDALLNKLRKNLTPNGKLVIEMMKVDFMKALANEDGTWEYLENGGLLSELPHYKLIRRVWDQQQKRLIDRNMLIDNKAEINMYEGIFHGFYLGDINKLFERNGYLPAKVIGDNLIKGSLTQHFVMIETAMA
ncbi:MULTISPECIES: class I SAM-dependent methyltransferase [unclassified Brenneria]|uniref:class I SAM-dependent methyltransferase n=1 Tax=unclassified Brenneria TaxID=2634434 RepID=UPI0015552CF3|nr:MULTISPECIES: class I SAM-dependent methyltransferase [unclassified Brenneria]MBJ7224070.1 class I SAM-dependent methyltransferase [Brenneria sp. L3-3C-1]MEE3645316.1 class I SAM-dependent methyltransferase [Brenneria sp. L3_3C_1]MEE3652996.1 class I SAM-dependent methyltransferase [Brenneria sp. HEZEL_4_2_4]NPD02949.1 class I SAM-dependent methyltransferase [Brenneria sp. hezel4-2-4]